MSLFVTVTLAPHLLPQISVAAAGRVENMNLHASSRLICWGMSV
jgi:hypothetical protein